MKKKITILGAGMSGLGAAWKLVDSGFDVELFDSASCVGGMSGSFKYNDAIFDLGTHGLHASKKENEVILDEVKNLLGDELIRVTRKASIYFRGKKFNYPLTAKEIFLGLDFSTSFYYFFDFLITRLKYRFNKINKNEESFAVWTKNRFGNKLYDLYFGPYTHRLWGIDPLFLSSKWAETRVPVISLWDTIKKSLFKTLSVKNAEHHSHSPYIKYFYYTHQGAGRITEKIAEQIIQNNGRIHLNCTVKKIMRNENYITEIIVENNGDTKVYSGDFFISTIPINEMAKIIEPALPDGILKAADNLRFRAMYLLYLIIAKENISSDQWVYFADGGIIFNRFSEFKNCSPYLMPSNKTSLCLEITCFKDDDLWNMDENEILNRCVDNLEKYRIIKRQDIVDSFTRKLPYAYPLWDLNYEKHLDKILCWIKNINNFVSIGRQGSFEYYNMDQCLKEGFEAARLIIEQCGIS